MVGRVEMEQVVRNEDDPFWVGLIALKPTTLWKIGSPIRARERVAIVGRQLVGEAAVFNGVACIMKASTWDEDIDSLEELGGNIERETKRVIAPENIRNR